jgi:hypothetical protein
LVVLDANLKALHLLEALCSFSHASIPFCSDYFAEAGSDHELLLGWQHVPPPQALFHWDGGLVNFVLPGLAWNCNSLDLSLPHSLGWRWTPLHLATYWLRWGLMTYVPRYASNHEPSELSLPIAGITSMSYWQYIV